MIQLKNGIRIFVNHGMKKDIYIGISDFGFEKDVYDEIIGIAHLLEHILISFDNRYFNANASTSRTYMSFWCEALKRKHYENAIKTAISWFFDKEGNLKTDFSNIILDNYIAELENEYYYRTEMYHCMDVLAYLYGGDLYNGGRITMLNKISDVKRILSDRMRRLSGKNIVIFIKKFTVPIYSLLVNTFGNIPKYPNIIPLDVQTINESKNNIIMMPYPFYTLLIQVDNNINNILAIICLVENYNLIDYETIGDRLYISISFSDEDQCEYFLYNVKDIEFDIDNIKLDLGEDYIMNLYVNFSLLKTDIDQYIHMMTTENKVLINGLKNNMYQSILRNKLIIIYPSFTKSFYNLTDKQNHGLLVLKDVNLKDNIEYHLRQYGNTGSSGGCIQNKNIFYRKTRDYNNSIISYNDNNFFNYATIYHFMECRYNSKKVYKFRTDNGMGYKHYFNNEDLTELINSDTFIRYNSSKPAVLYQYILLAYFVTDKSIKEILGYKNQIIQLDTWNLKTNTIVFGKTTRYDIYTKSMFICGIIKGSKINTKAIVGYMWKLKKLGLIYYLNHTKLAMPNTYYIFTFTIFVEKVYEFFSTLNDITKYCLIVSHKNDKSTIDDYSSLNKNIVINIK
ncbi:metalloprotease [Turkeypox virus]|uniref:Metalloendopeptidase n=1 Tax=Turkeypox virus TaxID=336486 RepID=A0A0M3ZJJ9_9POXV|nr:metalloprotease [Turkeypox virus]ALA62428.1 metalloprotease [Turkeypox virus]